MGPGGSCTNRGDKRRQEDFMIKLMRKIVLSSVFVATAFTLAAMGVQAQQSLSIEQVKDGLYAIIGNGGNVGVRVTSEGVILIDDKFPQDFAEIQELIGTVSDQPVRYVLNTHHHGDHSGGNVEYINIAEIIAHQNARDNMVRGNQDAPPRVVFSDQTAVYLGGIEVRAFYMGRGHTNGDAVIYFPDLRTVHGGDLLHGTAPFIDYGNGGSSEGWVATMNNILALDFDTAIPGHGAIMDRSDVVNFRNQMEAVRARMADLIRSGMPKSQASDRIRTQELSWTMAENGLFMQRSIPGFYDEIAAQLP
jgi:cyclase